MNKPATHSGVDIAGTFTDAAPVEATTDVMLKVCSQADVATSAVTI